MLDHLKHITNDYFAGSEPWEIVLRTIGTLIVAQWTMWFIGRARQVGLKKVLAGSVVTFARSVPGVEGAIRKEVKVMLSKLEHDLQKDTANEPVNVALPDVGLPQQQLLDTMKRWSSIETLKWNEGQVSGAVYHGGQEFMDFLVKAYGYFAFSNPLHPELFPFVRKMEAEVVAMTASLYHGDQKVCGLMTSGGTESILNACQSYREFGRIKKGISEPELIIATTAHAAFRKACHYFGMKLVTVEVDPVTFQMDIKAVKRAINKNTVALVGSAPCFPQGTIDPIEELSLLAVKHKIGLHVDSCLGSLLLPFVAELGFPVNKFDFALPGVTSISTDTHKYGYAPKGSSVLLYRSPEYRAYQYFVAGDWTGGIYASPGMPGSRPGGLIAATWATLMAMGSKGYKDCAREIMTAVKKIENGIKETPGLYVLGSPQSSVIAFAADEKSGLNTLKISEAMSQRGWHLNTLQKPASIHICCTFLHRKCADRFVSDLRVAVGDVRNNPQKYKGGVAAIYGMADTLSETSLLSDVTKGFLDVILQAKPQLTS